MGLYAIALSTIERIRREHWGHPVSQDDLVNGQSRDPGLQEFVDELSFALADNSATVMPETWNLVAPQNAPAITIHGDGGITIINNNNETVNLTVDVINNITEVINTATTGVTGTVSVLTDIDVSVASSGNITLSGCTGTVTVTNTVTITKTFTDLNFTTGLLTSEA